MLPYSDSYSYFLWAKDIASGDFGAKAFMKWPLYAYFLALMLKLFKGNSVAVYFFQFLLGAANCVLVYFIGKKIFNLRTGVVAGLLCACSGLLVFYDSLLMYVSLSLFLNSLLFLFILRVEDKPDNNKLFWLGIFLGICLITQASIGLFGVLAVIWILKSQKAGTGGSLSKFTVFIFGLAVIVGGVTLRNYLVEKDFVLVAGNVGFNFYSGNNSKANGTFYCPPNISLNQEDMFRDSAIIARAKTGRDLKTSGVSGYWLSESLDFIRRQPGKWLGLLSRKINYVFSSKEFMHDLEFSFLEEKARAFKVMLMDLRFILPLSLLGAFLGIRKFRQAKFLYLFLAAAALSITIFFVTSRYRVVMVPFFLIFAAYGLTGIWDSLRDKRYTLALLFCSVVYTSFILIDGNRSAIERNMEIPEYDSPAYSYLLNRALVYEIKNDYQNALNELELALKLEPDNYRGIFQQGVVYSRLNVFGHAGEKFKEVIKLNSLCSDAYYNLGLFITGRGRLKKQKLR